MCVSSQMEYLTPSTDAKHPNIGMQLLHADHKIFMSSQWIRKGNCKRERGVAQCTILSTKWEYTSTKLTSAGKLASCVVDSRSSRREDNY